MDWSMVWIGSIWLETLGWLLGFTVFFGILVRLMPCNPGMYWWKDGRAAFTDVFYWFIVPLLLRIGRLMMLIVGVALLFRGQDPDFLPVKHWPLWQQCLAILVIEDVLLYASHRLFHTALGWRFHAIHHSPEVLDWPATARFHPVNLLLSGHLADVAVLLMGFSPEALVLLTPLNTFYSALVHANLNWTFGPFKYLLASPVFHRWHHTTLAQGRDKNFASTFPILDVIFGTFYMPAGVLPEQFGAGDPDFPRGFLPQLLYPFRWAPSSGSSATPGWVAWARRSPVAASFLGIVSVASVCLMIGGIFTIERLVNRNEQLTRQVSRAQIQQSQAETARHAAQLDLARRAWADNDLVLATGILDEEDGRFHDNGDHQQLRELCQRKSLVLKGHGRPVGSVAISGDGHWLVTGSDDGAVKIWDARTAQELRTLTGHTRAVHGVALTVGSRLNILSGSWDSTIRLWSAKTGQATSELHGHSGAVLHMAVSEDGQTIVSGGADMTARVWDADTGKTRLILTGHLGAVTGVACSGKGERIVTASGSMVKVWDGRTGQVERVLEGHADLVYCVAITPDGKHIVSGSYDECVKVWEAETGAEKFTLAGHVGPVYSVAISQDGSRILSAGRDQTVRVWDGATGQEKLTLKGHTNTVTSVAISADGKHYVSGSADLTVRVWDAKNCALRDFRVPSQGD